MLSFISWLIIASKCASVTISICEGPCEDPRDISFDYTNSSFNLTSLLEQYAGGNVLLIFYTKTDYFPFTFSLSGLRGAYEIKRDSDSAEITLYINVDNGKSYTSLNFGNEKVEFADSVHFISTKSTMPIVEFNSLTSFGPFFTFDNVQKVLKTGSVTGDVSLFKFTEIHIYDTTSSISFQLYQTSGLTLSVGDQNINFYMTAKRNFTLYLETQVKCIIDGTEQQQEDTKCEVKYVGTKPSEIPTLEFKDFPNIIFSGDWPESTIYDISDRNQFCCQLVNIYSNSRILPISYSFSRTSTNIILNQTNTIITGSIASNVRLSFLEPLTKETTLTIKGDFSGKEFDLGSSFMRLTIGNLNYNLEGTYYPFLFRVGKGGSSTVVCQKSTYSSSTISKFNIAPDFTEYLNDDKLSNLLNNEWKILTLPEGTSLPSFCTAELPSEPFIHGFIKGDSVISLDRPSSVSYVTLKATSPDNSPLIICYDNGDDLCDSRYAVEISNIKSLGDYFRPGMKTLRLTLMKSIPEIDISVFDSGYENCQFYISASSKISVDKIHFGFQDGISLIELTNLNIQEADFRIKNIKFTHCTAAEQSGIFTFTGNEKVTADDDFIRTFMPRINTKLNLDYIMDLYDAISLNDDEYVFYDFDKNDLSVPCQLKYSSVSNLNIIYDIGMTSTAEENNLNLTMNTLSPPAFKLTFDRISQEYRNEAELVLYNWRKTENVDFKIEFDHKEFPIKIVLTEPYNPKQLEVTGTGKVSIINRYENKIVYCACEGDRCNDLCPSTSSQIKYSEIDDKLKNTDYDNYTIYIKSSTVSAEILLQSLNKKLVQFIGLTTDDDVKDTITINNENNFKIDTVTTTTQFYNLNILATTKTTKLIFGSLDFIGCLIDVKFKEIEMEIKDFFCTFSSFSLFKKVTILDNCVVTGEMATEPATVNFVEDDNANDLKVTLTVDAIIEMGDSYIKIGQTRFNIVRSSVYDCVIDANQRKSLEIKRASGASDAKIPLVLFRSCNAPVKFCDGWDQSSTTNYIFLFNDIEGSIITLQGPNTPISVSVDSGDFKLVSSSKITGINGHINYALSTKKYEITVEYSTGLTESSISIGDILNIGSGINIKFTQPHIRLTINKVEGALYDGTAEFSVSHYSNIEGDSQVIIKEKLSNSKLSKTQKVDCAIKDPLTNDKVKAYGKAEHILLKVSPSDLIKASTLEYIGTPPTTHGFVDNMLISVNEANGDVLLTFYKFPELVPWDICYKTKTSCEIPIDESTISGLNTLLPSGELVLNIKFGETNTKELRLDFTEFKGSSVSVVSSSTSESALESNFASTPLEFKVKFGFDNIAAVSLSNIIANTVETSFKISSLTLEKGASISNLNGCGNLTVDFETWKSLTIETFKNPLTIKYDQELLTFSEDGWRLSNELEISATNFPDLNITFTGSNIKFEADEGLTKVQPIKLSTISRKISIGSHFDSIQSPIIDLKLKYEPSQMTVVAESFPFVIFPKLMNADTLQLDVNILPYTTHSPINLYNINTVIDFSKSDATKGKLNADSINFEGISSLGEKNAKIFYPITTKNVESRRGAISTLDHVQISNSVRLIDNATLKGVFEIPNCNVTLEWQLDHMPKMIFNTSTDKTPYNIILKFIGGDSVKGKEDAYNTFLVHKTFTLIENIDKSKCKEWLQKINLESNINYFNSKSAVFDIECIDGNMFLFGRRAIPVDSGDDSDSGGSPSKLSTGGIVGIVIGVIAAIALICGAVFYFVIRKKKNEKVNYNNLNSDKLYAAQDQYI